ncbi:PA domain-containing protein [Agromyces indicus]|uniref:PA domain-containing protein n=1 Tax=Agromyces indicus TaxID=758919 RepID=A0ABU1FNV4_9MICO|nr:PA domain-containing protein [Agromyces indicus]MDR5693432.1 PA domain-containing protein [Agromyces indicus]
MYRSAALAGTAIVAAGALLLGAGPVLAHDEPLVDDGVLDSGKETHNHHSHGQQHGEEEGHLPASSENVLKIGNLDLFEGAEQPGRIADVSAYGNYAYLTAFWEPACDRGGVYIVDIADPEAPKVVTKIDSHRGTFSGEGSQVIDLNTEHFTGQLLAYQNEICPGDDKGIGGVTLVDVTNPAKPKKLVEGAGDFDVPGKAQTKAHETHSIRMWTDGDRAYVVLVDNEESADVDILDITNPSKPVLVSETDLVDESAQPLGEVHGDATFLHDMVVEEVDGVMTMLLSYWDGGYIKLNVDDPANPVFIDDTDFEQFDPVRLEVAGEEITPEGNAHQAEFTHDREFFIATDEDFDPYRVIAQIEGAGEFTAVQGSDVPQISPEQSLAGGTRYVGLACTAASVPAPAGATVAVVERGTCAFTDKVQAVEAAGYEGAIVFNSDAAGNCDALVSMLVDAGIPAVFASRTDGFRILTGGVPAGYTCGSGTPYPVPLAVGDPGRDVDVSAVFDGWGYVHLYDAETMEDLDQYYVPESQDAAYASGFGDLSVHEIATDPDENLAYVSYYAAGFRVVEYDRATGLNEVGHFIEEGGNNFWGVEVHEHPNGEKYVLASDRDSGLYIFQYDPEG